MLRNKYYFLFTDPKWDWYPIDRLVARSFRMVRRRRAHAALRSRGVQPNGPVTRLVVAVCTNQLDDLEARWEHNIAQVKTGEFVVLLDMSESAESLDVTGRIRSRGGEVICHGARHQPGHPAR
jgi:hypothetical protein